MTPAPNRLEFKLVPPHVFHEFSGRKPREQWPTEFDIEGVERDHKIRTEKLNEDAMGKSLSTNSFIGGASIDLGKPQQVAYNPHDPKNEYPKMLYHPTKKDVNWAAEHKRITLYNKLHPEKMMLLPVVPAAFVVVQDKKQEEAKLGEGFKLRPPAEPDDAEVSDEQEERLCSRGCGREPHGGRCKSVTAEVA